MIDPFLVFMGFIVVIACIAFIGCIVSLSAMVADDTESGSAARDHSWNQNAAVRESSSERTLYGH